MTTGFVIGQSFRWALTLFLLWHVAHNAHWSVTACLALSAAANEMHVITINRLIRMLHALKQTITHIP